MSQDIGQRSVRDPVYRFLPRSGHESQDSRAQHCAYGPVDRFGQRYDHVSQDRLLQRGARYSVGLAAQHSGDERRAASGSVARARPWAA
eukprot:4678489-Alexandrium_andersonii.AAC.1